MKDPAGSKAKASFCRVVASETLLLLRLASDRPPTFSRMSAASVSSSPALCSFEAALGREEFFAGTGDDSYDFMDLHQLQHVRPEVMPG